MGKKLKELISIDKDFIPALADDGDELYPNGIFVFNITKMIKHLHKNKDKISPENVDVKVHRNGLSALTESHIDNTDITIPIILAEIRPGIYNVIDGNHRLEKAYRKNIDFIPGYKLKPEQHMPFLTSIKAYHAYVEYWNSKVRQDHRYRKQQNI